MSTCYESVNQPIYQALLDKAASYPPDKSYQAKAYKTAAESVRTWNYNLYQDLLLSVPGVGYSIENFIKDFIHTNPQPKPEPPKSVEPTISFPILPNNDAARAAFQAKVNASKLDIPGVQEAFTQLLTALNFPPKPVDLPKKTAPIKATTEKKDEPYNPDMALFIALAKNHDAKNIIENPTFYFSYYESLAKWGSVKGSTKAEKMEDCLSRWSDGAAREILMKQLFEKNKLVFSNSAMTLYNEWQKTYKPAVNSNRYKKMCTFIEAHKALFTA